MTNQNPETQISVIRNNMALLCCPECRGDLSFGDEARRNGASLDLQNYLSCHICDHVFPIINGVVVFDEKELVQEAISFSTQWYQFQKTQFDTDDIDESRIRFRTETGIKCLVGKVVCDYGTGPGRFFKQSIALKPKLAVAIDASDAIFVARQNFKESENAIFLKCDLLKPPLKDGVVDVGYCIGVLHHVTDPIKGFLQIIRTIKPEGQFALSVYENSLFDRPDRNSVFVAFKDVLWTLNVLRAELFRFIGSRLPSSLMLKYCVYVVPVLYQLNKVPILRVARYLFPSTCYRHLPVEWSMCDTMDTYATKVVHQYRAKTIFHWFRQAKFVEINLLNSRAGWVSVTGKKSASAPLKQRDFEQELSAPVFFRR